MEAVIARQEAVDAVRKKVHKELEAVSRRSLLLPRRLRSGLERDAPSDAGPSTQRSERARRRTQINDEGCLENDTPPPNPVQPLQPPRHMERLKGRYIECPLRISRSAGGDAVQDGRWIPYVGVVGDVNVAGQSFSVAFLHELFLKMDDGLRSFPFHALNSSRCYLVTYARAVEQWTVRAAACGAGMESATRSWVSDGCPPNTTWVRYLAKPVTTALAPMRSVASARTPQGGGSGRPHMSGSHCAQQDVELREGCPVEVWWDKDHTGRGRTVSHPDWYPGRVQVILNGMAHVVYDVDEAGESDEAWHPLGDLHIDRSRIDEDADRQLHCADLRSQHYDPSIATMNLADLNAVDEDDAEEEAEILQQTNEGNWKEFLRARRKMNAQLCTGRVVAINYDGGLTSDEYEIIGRKLSASERVRCSDIAIGFKALRKSVGAQRETNKVRSFHVPRRMSLLDIDVLRDGAQLHMPLVNTMAVSSSERDGFTTLLLHLPAAEVRAVLCGGPMLPTDAGHLMHGAAAAWVDAAPFLRGLGYDLGQAGGFIPSRGTQQFFGGFDANPHKAESILRQAMGVHRGNAFVAGIQHRDLRIPTLVARSYVEGGAVRLGQWLHPVSLARRKHSQRCVLNGRWSGMSFQEAFLDGLDVLFDSMSTHLLLALLAADGESGLRHLKTVPFAVRLGLLSIHTTYAFYFGGVLHKEATEHVAFCEACVAQLQSGADDVMSNAQPPGARLAEALAESTSSRLKAGIRLLPAHMQRRLQAETALSRTHRAPGGGRHAAEFAFSSTSGARLHYNPLAADFRVPLSKGVYHLHTDADADMGETFKGPEFFATAFSTVVGDALWVPPDLDPSTELSIGNATVQATRFWICMLHIWMPRRLATIGRLWKRLGYEVVRTALAAAVEAGDPHRDRQVLKHFTRQRFASIISLTYDDHLERTAHAFFPGCFWDDSRTAALHQYVLCHYTASDLSPGSAYRAMLSGVCVLAWAVLQLRPEVGHYFLQQDSTPDLVAAFCDVSESDPSFELVAELRELWAKAPVNWHGESCMADGRAAILAEIHSHARQDKGCYCSATSRCVLGRAAQERHVKVSTQRAQMPAYHLASKSKNGQVQERDEARFSGLSLAAFLSDVHQMADLERATTQGGEQAVIRVLHSRRGKKLPSGERPYLGVYMMSDVRATMFGRLVTSCVQRLRLEHEDGEDTPCNEITIPGSTEEQPHLAEEPTKRVLAFVTSPRAGVSLKSKEVEAVVREVLAHGDHVCTDGEYLLPKLAKAWVEFQASKNPDLVYVLPILLEDMRLGYRWDPSRKEEPPCETAKGVVGQLVDLGLIPASAREFMKGQYPAILAAATECGVTDDDTATPTGFPAVPATLHGKFATYATEAGSLKLRRGAYLPRSATTNHTAPPASPPASQRGHGAGRSGSTPLEETISSSSGCNLNGVNTRLTAALCELRRARKTLTDADAAVAAAKDHAKAMRAHIAALQDGPAPNQLFKQLRDDVCGGDARLAYHMWVACAGSHKWCCALHLDDLDLGLLLNLICSIGVSSDNQIVPLHGSLLMIVVCISTVCLAKAPRDLLGGTVNFAHDTVGNVIVLEPNLTDVKLPAGHAKADVSTTEAVVLAALAEGRCVLAFFRSGGVVAAQLGHHWHLVTAMDPQDIVEGVVRIAGITYPQRAAIVSETALQTQDECSDKAAATLAAQLCTSATATDSNGKGEGDGSSPPKRRRTAKV